VAWLDRVRVAIRETRWLFFPIVIFVFGAYLIDVRRSVYLGLIFVGWSFASVYTRLLLREGIGRVLFDAVAETRCDTRLEVSVFIETVLAQPAIAATFERLRALGRLPPDLTVETWRQELVRTYATRRGVSDDSPPVERVVFEVRSGQLWKDGQYRGSDSTHEDTACCDWCGTSS